MDRKQFLGRSLQVVAGVGLGCPCLLGAEEKAVNPGPAAATPKDTGCPPLAPAHANATTFEKRTEFAKKWIGRFMRVLDERFDETTRCGLMQANGRACAIAAYGPVDPAKTMTLDALMALLAKHLGPENARREGDVVYFSYEQRKDAPRLAEGYCFCKLVEDGPADLSPTYCNCSAGHVAYVFEKHTGKAPVRVEVLESVRRGGKACRFAVHVWPSDGRHVVLAVSETEGRVCSRHQGDDGAPGVPP